MYFLRLKHHMSLMSFSVTDLRTCLNDSMSSTLHEEHENDDDLLGICCSLDHLPLDMVEKLLNWIEPRTVLGIEEDIDFELATCFQYLRVMMELNVVHKQYYIPSSQMTIRANMVEHLEQHFFKESSIICTFNDFTA